jgi:predicted protein tyrosine phosphatase
VLRDVGKRSGDQSLYEQVQCELLDAQMRAAMTANPAITASTGQAGSDQADPNRADSSQPGPKQAGSDQAGADRAAPSQAEAGPAPILEDSVRDRTAARCQELLQQCEAGPDALRLLDWAAAARLTLDPEILIGVTRRVIAPWLAQDNPADRVDDELRRRAHRVAGFWPEFRSGLVICLTGLSRDTPSTLLAVMSGPIGELVVLEDLRAHPALAELYLICLARRRRDRRVDNAVRIAERRGSQPIDETLLALIWPSAGWTRAEALEIRKRLSPRQLAGPGVLGWFYQAAEQELRPDDIKAHVLLCQQLLASSLAERLGDRQVAHLEAMIELDRLARNTTTLEDLIPFIAAAASSDSAPVRGLLRSRVIAALVRVDVGPDQLVRAVQLLPPDVLGVYLLKVQGLLAQLEIPPAHLAGLWMLACSGLDPQRAEQVSQLLDYAVVHVRRRDLDEVARLLETLNPSMATEFQTVASEARAGAAGRAVRSVAGRLATFARGRSQDSEAGSAQDTGQEPKG